MGFSYSWWIEYDGAEPWRVVEAMAEALRPLVAVLEGPARFDGAAIAELQAGGQGHLAWAVAQGRRYIFADPEGAPIVDGDLAGAAGDEPDHPIPENTAGLVAVEPSEMLVVYTQVVEGAEPASFALARYPDEVPGRSGALVQTHVGTGWRWHSFCTTRYQAQVAEAAGAALAAAAACGARTRLYPQ